MTQPYYTTLEVPGQVVYGTAGPADENAGTRAKGYAIFSGLMALVPILTAFKVITDGQGAAIGTFVQGALGLAGSFGFAFVAKKTSNQVKNGTFAPPPPPPAVPAVNAVEGIKAVQSQAQELFDAVAGGLGMVQDAAKVLGTLSGMAKNPLTTDFLNRP